MGWNVNIHRPNSPWRQLLTTSPISSLDYHFQSKQDQKWLRISQINLCVTSFFLTSKIWGLTVLPSSWSFKNQSQRRFTPLIAFSDSLWKLCRKSWKLCPTISSRSSIAHLSRRPLTHIKEPRVPDGSVFYSSLVFYLTDPQSHAQ